MKTTNRKFIFACFLFIAVCAVAASAWAKDAVVAAITTPMTPSNPIIIQNGTQYSQGTYAIGTIQLFYTVPAYQFPAGNFGYFTLDLIHSERQEYAHNQLSGSVEPQTDGLGKLGSRSSYR